MPPRPAVKGKEPRPVSAIYIGSASKQTANSSNNNDNGGGQTSGSSSSPRLHNGSSSNRHDLPDLPEPPSPNSSLGSRDSGLPSPPATNSTGSGSTGDPGSVPRRQRPLSLASDSSASTSGSSRTMTSTYKRTSIITTSSRSSSRLADANDFNDDDDDNSNDLDGDDTARLDRPQHARGSSESVRAMRAMSLTQRNRLAIDKLSKLSSPSPTPGQRSPLQPATFSSSRLRPIRPLSRTASREPAHSGSETERESTSGHTHSSQSYSSTSRTSSSQRPVTPPANSTFSNTSSSYSRTRKNSNPDSSPRSRLLNAGSGLNDSPTRRRKRASMANTTSITQNYDNEGDTDGENPFTTNSTGRDRLRDDRDTVRNITESALAAVASSRRSPVGTRKRAALPREFREDASATASSADAGSVASETRSRRSEDSSRPNRLSALEPRTPYRSNVRATTLRETRRSGSISQWASEDDRSIAPRAVSPTDATKSGRKQVVRGGSAESPLALRSPGGRTLLGEGLRAAGLAHKKEDSSPTAGELFRDRLERSPGERRAATYSRASTSMGSYRYRDREDDEARSHKATYSVAEAHDLSLTRKNREISLTRAEREQLGLDGNAHATAPLPRLSTVPIAKSTPQHLQERYTASPTASKRQSTLTPGPGSGEHSRLMVDSLNAFESVLAKLPAALGQNSAGSVPSNTELLKHAQTLVTVADRLNALMRQGTTRALEEQINAEVDGEESGVGRDMMEVWKQVGGEYREGLRASDELVRSITSFLMDMSSVLRKLASAPAISDFGSPAVHSRAVSLEGDLRPPTADGSEVSSGRRSAASRRSWEPVLRNSEREKEREESLRQLTSGRESSLGGARASPAILAIRERQKTVFQTPSPGGTRSASISTTSSSSARRLFVPREQTRQADDDLSAPPRFNESTIAIHPSDSQRTVQGQEVDPSPTPASRIRSRDRALPPVPRTSPDQVQTRSPPTTGSTSSSERQVPARSATHERRKPSVASIATIRGSGQVPSLTTPSSTTTGVSNHTVSSSPVDGFMHRTNSHRSVRSQVVFSQPSETPASDRLNGIKQQAMDGERRRATEPPRPPSSAGLRTPTAATMASASEESKRWTLAGRPSRMSVDEGSGATENGYRRDAHAADRSAVMTLSAGRRERRRTVTDVWAAAQE